MSREAEYKQLVSTIALGSGVAAARLFEQLYRLAHSKQPCDICMKDGVIFQNVTVGTDFVFALEFEATIETILGLLCEVKVISGDFDPVVRIALEDIHALAAMPKTAVTSEEVEKVDAKAHLTNRNEKGETLEGFIRRAYQPKTEAELHHYAARYVAALQRKS